MCNQWQLLFLACHLPMKSPKVTAHDPARLLIRDLGPAQTSSLLFAPRRRRNSLGTYCVGSDVRTEHAESPPRSAKPLPNRPASFSPEPFQPCHLQLQTAPSARASDPISPAPQGLSSSIPHIYYVSLFFLYFLFKSS